MKIDRIYISCCKNDFYFTRICVASVRYWNKEIPISLLKDLSRGEFDTSELENHFSVTLAPLEYKNLNAYCKLYPFISSGSERIFLIDSDVVWLGNLIPVLEQFDEDLIVDGSHPENYEQEVERWYFNTQLLHKNYPDYQYPGFLFNTGQIVLNTSKFSSKDFQDVITWKENISPDKEGVFLCEDQGIINYIVAKKLFKGELTVGLHHFFYWGWGPEVKDISVIDIEEKKDKPFLIHWYGKKIGLTSFLPGKEILDFYEHYYFKSINKTKISFFQHKLKRTMNHLDAFVYESAKKVFYQFKNLMRKNDN